MSSQLESTIQAAVVLWARQHGFLTIKVHERYQLGWPDRLFIAPSGECRWIEFKKPGQYPKPIQVRIHKELAQRNHRVYTVTTRHESIQLLQDALDTPRIPGRGD